MEMDTRYDAQLFDQEIKKFWQENKIYRYEAETNKKIFSIDTPPPTVSGSLHIGHIFSYTHGDVIARYKRMQGYAVFYPMGFDDNGLPTERFVEKKNGIKAHHMKRSQFINLCLQECAAVEKTFEELWSTMGLSVDWSLTYSTISDEVRRIAQASFIELFNKGYIYRKQEPSLYCTTCQTSVAQAELDSIETPSTFNQIAFQAAEGSELLIATTRPELLPACVALFFHPDDSRYKHLKGQQAKVPLFGNQVPIMADEKVDPTKGTGLVMCCTFGDQTDIYWFKKHSLPLVQVIDRNGQWLSNSGGLEGLKAHEARKKILQLLREAGVLKNQTSITHHVQTHERCKQEIEYFILSQWFVEILKHKEDFLRLADKINWYPSYMKNRYIDWVTHLNWDWCISRQRFFGIPFPVWHCQDCGHSMLASLSMLPVDPQELKYPDGFCSACNSSNVQADTDVMDTWNTSSLTPQILARWSIGNERIKIPMSMRPQAHDIIRTWAFDTIVKSFYHQGTIPWNDIMISGHVLAGKEKISKSRENEKMSPQALLTHYSPDVVRYWAASGKLGTDTAWSENQLKIGQKLVTKLWNAMRFCKDFISDFTPTASCPSLDAINSWLLDGCGKAVRLYCTSFEEYEYSQALEVIEKFFWHDFCDNYLELIKDRMFHADKYTQEELFATKYVIYNVSLTLLKAYAPFIPFVTEKLYQLIFRDKERNLSLHTTLLSQENWMTTYTESSATMQVVLQLIGQVRKLKSEHHLSLKTEIACLTICSSNPSVLNQLEGQLRIVAGSTHAQRIELVEQALADSYIIHEQEVIHAYVVI